MAAARAAGANNFDSLRLIFAVLVIFSHAYPLLRGSNDSEPLYVLSRGQATFGEISVWGFFAISGFLITKSWIRAPRPKDYLKKRVARIYPGFIVAALIGAYCVVPIALDPGASGHVSLLDFTISTLRLLSPNTPPIFGANATPNVLNGSLWSVPFEFWCYLGVMILGVSGLLARRFLLVPVFIAVIACHLYLDLTGWQPGGKIFGQIFGYPVFWVTVLPFFLAGMLFHLYQDALGLSRTLIAVAALALGVSFFIPHAFVVTMPIFGSYLLMAAAYAPALHPLNLGRFGDFSYGVYLYAFPIEQLLAMFAGHMSPALLFLFAAPLSLVAGIISWFLIEKRFLSRPSKLVHEGKLAA